MLYLSVYSSLLLKALDKGLVNRCVADNELDNMVVEYSKKVALRSSFNLRMIKEACNEADNIRNFEPFIKAAFSHWVHVSNDLPLLKPGKPHPTLSISFMHVLGVKSIIGKDNVAKARSKL